MPKNLGLYNNNLSAPRKQDVDAVQNELDQLTTDVDTHIGDINNPHQVTKAQVGLGNVANVLQYSADNPPPYPVTSVNGKTGVVSLAASDVGALSTTGGILTGNLTGRYLTGTWLQSTEVTDLNSPATKIAVIDSSGWVYYRTAIEILNDIGVPVAIQAAIGDAIAASY